MMKAVSSLVFGLLVLHGRTVAENLSSVDFLKFWQEYDTDGNDYIDKAELDHLLRDTFQENYPDQPVDPDTMSQYKEEMLSTIDTNQDGKLGLAETAVLLNAQGNYLVQNNFVNQASPNEDEIIQMFHHYDQNDSYHLEDDELAGFLYDLIRRSHEDTKFSQVEAYKSVILQTFDNNGNGKTEMQEFAEILVGK